MGLQLAYLSTHIVDQRCGLMKALILKVIGEVYQMLIDLIELLGIVLDNDELDEETLERLISCFHGWERFGTKILI